MKTCEASLQSGLQVTLDASVHCLAAELGVAIDSNDTLHRVMRIHTLQKDLLKWIPKLVQAKQKVKACEAEIAELLKQLSTSTESAGSGASGAEVSSRR